MEKQKSVNSPGITATGRLGGDPERKTSPEKVFDFMKFSLAVHENEGGKKTTRWVDVVANGELMESVSHLKKGDLVSVVGTEKTKTHEGKSYVSLVATEINKKDQQLVKGNLVDTPALKNVREGLDVLEMTVVNNDASAKSFHAIKFYNDQAHELSALKLEKGDFISVSGFANSKLLPAKTEGEKERLFEWVNGKTLNVLSLAKDRAKREEQINELLK